MDLAHCPDCGAPAVLVVDVLAVCERDCGWSHPVTLRHGRGGLWYRHLQPGKGWWRRWCSAEVVQ